MRLSGPDWVRVLVGRHAQKFEPLDAERLGPVSVQFLPGVANPRRSAKVIDAQLQLLDKQQYANFDDEPVT